MREKREINELWRKVIKMKKENTVGWLRMYDYVEKLRDKMKIKKHG